MQFGYCKVALSPMRSDKKDSAEMVNQLVFGEAIEIIDKDANWIYIKSSYDLQFLLLPQQPQVINLDSFK